MVTAWRTAKVIATTIWKLLEGLLGIRLEEILGGFSGGLCGNVWSTIQKILGRMFGDHREGCLGNFWEYC